MKRCKTYELRILNTTEHLTMAEITKLGQLSYETIRRKIKDIDRLDVPDMEKAVRRYTVAVSSGRNKLHNLIDREGNKLSMTVNDALGLEGCTAKNISILRNRFAQIEKVGDATSIAERKYKTIFSTKASGKTREAKYKEYGVIDGVTINTNIWKPTRTHQNNGS